MLKHHFVIRLIEFMHLYIEWKTTEKKECVFALKTHLQLLNISNNNNKKIFEFVNQFKWLKITARELLREKEKKLNFRNEQKKEGKTWSVDDFQLDLERNFKKKKWTKSKSCLWKWTTSEEKNLKSQHSAA